MTAYAVVDTKFYPQAMRDRWNAFREGVDRGVRDYPMHAQQVDEYGIDMNAWRGHDMDMIRNVEMNEQAPRNIFDIFENMSEHTHSFRDIDFDRTRDR